MLSDPLLEALELGISNLFPEEQDEEQEDKSQDEFHSTLEEKTETSKKHGRCAVRDREVVHVEDGPNHVLKVRKPLIRYWIPISSCK